MPEKYVPGDFDRNHIGLTFGGLLPGNETWVCSLKLAGATSGDIPFDTADAILNEMSLQGWMESTVADTVKTFFQSPQTHIHPAVWLTYAKLSRYGKNGRLRNNNPSEVYEHVYPSATINTGSQYGITQHPNQIALAVTLLTDVTRGPAHKGRFYLPMPALAVDNNGQIAQNMADEVAQAASNFVVGLSDVPGIDLPGSPGVVVMSRKAGSAITREVTGVAVGRALDTIRSRRGKVSEAYNKFVADQGAF